MDLSHNCSLHGGMSQVCEKISDWEKIRSPDRLINDVIEFALSGNASASCSICSVGFLIHVGRNFTPTILGILYLLFPMNKFLPLIYLLTLHSQLHKKSLCGGYL